MISAFASSRPHSTDELHLSDGLAGGSEAEKYVFSVDARLIVRAFQQRISMQNAAAQSGGR